MIGPVERAASRAESLLAIRYRCKTGQRRTEVQHRTQPPYVYIRKGVANPVARRSARGRAGANKVNRQTHIHAEMLAEVVSHAGGEVVDHPIGIVGAAKFHVGREPSIIMLRAWSRGLSAGCCD